MSGERNPDNVVEVEERHENGQVLYYVVSSLGIAALGGAKSDGPYTSRTEAEQVRDTIRSAWGSSY